MREVVRLLLKENKVENGYIVSVLAKPSILNKDYPEIEKEILALFKKTKLLI